MSTGIITNDAVTGATPATLYAKVNERGMTSAIYQQIFTPRFGDGPDVIIGPGRAAIAKALIADKIDIDQLSKDKGRPALKTLDEIDPGATRALVVTESSAFDLQRAIRTTMGILSHNPRGYFLMVEWDTHTDNVRRGLDRMVQIDQAIERTAAPGRRGHPDSLHGRPLVRLARPRRRSDATAARRAGSGRGPGEGRGPHRRAHAGGPDGRTATPAKRCSSRRRDRARSRVKGYLANTDLFGIMMDALGLKAN